MHESATDIRALPAEIGPCGFRLLVLRQFEGPPTPPAFAFIAQHLLRMPDVRGRHGLSFSLTFRPEIVTWLISELGRPSLHDGQRKPYRNPRWPVLSWHSAAHLWPDESRSTEWYAEAAFQEGGGWPAFQMRWRERLGGGIEDGA